MRTSLLVLASLFILPAYSASGQELVDELGLAAAVTGGLADGAEILIGSLGKGKVAAVGEGAYDVVLADGTMKFLFTEPETCVFFVHSQLEGEGTSEVSFDLTKVTGIEVRDQGEWEGLKATLVTFQGPEGVMQTLMNGEWVKQPMAISFLATTMTTEEITTAADELRRRCPGG